MAPDSKDASPSASEPIRPRYTEVTAANLPKRVKPAIGGEATSECIRRAVRGDRGGRVSKEGRRNLGDPARCPPMVGGQRREGIHNLSCGCGRKSERPIVAVKRSNVRGAKGPYCSSRSHQRRGEPIERELYYGPGKG
jgi:hypothetical protein